MENRHFKHRPCAIEAYQAEQNGIIVDGQMQLFYYKGDYVITENDKKKVMMKDKFESTYIEIDNRKEP
jgi:hypothetical protein